MIAICPKKRTFNNTIKFEENDGKAFPKRYKLTQILK